MFFKDEQSQINIIDDYYIIIAANMTYSKEYVTIAVRLFVVFLQIQVSQIDDDVIYLNFLNVFTGYLTLTKC